MNIPGTTDIKYGPWIDSDNNQHLSLDQSTIEYRLRPRKPVMIQFRIELSPEPSPGIKYGPWIDNQGVEPIFYEGQHFKVEYNNGGVSVCIAPKSLVWDQGTGTGNIERCCFEIEQKPSPETDSLGEWGDWNEWLPDTVGGHPYGYPAGTDFQVQSVWDSREEAEISQPRNKTVWNWENIRHFRTRIEPEVEEWNGCFGFGFHTGTLFIRNTFKHDDPLLRITCKTINGEHEFSIEQVKL